MRRIRRSFWARNILKVPKKLKLKTKDGKEITFRAKNTIKFRVKSEEAKNG